MNKKILLLTLLPLIGCAHSDTYKNYHELTADELKTSMVAPYANLPEELPKPGSGLQIKSLKELDKDAYDHYLQDKKNLIKEVTHENPTNEAKFITDTVNLTNVNIADYEQRKDLENTELKQTLEQVPLIFKYNKLPQSNNLQTVGFAPGGMQSDKGWSTINEFFKHKAAGACKYERSFYNLKQGAITLPKEYTSYVINDKPNVIYNYGNKTYGYIYTIEWFEDDYTNTLLCADLKSSAKIAEAVLTLAKDIAKHNK